MFAKKYRWWMLTYLVVESTRLQVGSVFYKTDKPAITLSMTQIEAEKDSIREELQLKETAPVQILNFQPVLGE